MQAGTMEAGGNPTSTAAAGGATGAHQAQTSKSRAEAGDQLRRPAGSRCFGYALEDSAAHHFRRCDGSAG